MRLEDQLARGDLDGVARLVQEDPSCVWDENDAGWTPADSAVFLGNLDIVQLLFRVEPKVFTKKNRLGQTATHRAAKKNKTSILRWLWKQNPDLFLARDRKGSSPIDVLRKANNLQSEEQVRSFLRSEPSTDRRPPNPVEFHSDRFSTNLPCAGLHAEGPTRQDGPDSVHGSERSNSESPRSSLRHESQRSTDVHKVCLMVEKLYENGPQESEQGETRNGEHVLRTRADWEQDTQDREFEELRVALATAFGESAALAVMCAWGIEQSVEVYSPIPHPTNNGLPMQYEMLAGREKIAMDQLLAGNRQSDSNCMELAAAVFDCETHSWPHAPVYVALAVAHSRVDRRSVNVSLRAYATAMSSSTAWDPVMLLAAARTARTQGWGSSVTYSLLALYYTVFRPQAEQFMTQQDWEELQAATQARAAKRSTLGASTHNPVAMWKQMKDQLIGAFPAMDELMDMTGLKQVKLQALAILRKIESDKLLSVRQRVPLRLNFAFMGNPGTGKTMVAKLFARILHETEARSSAIIEETTGQKMIQDGAMKADAVIQKAMNGVLFIDEAHSLDPKQNRSEGPAIVTKLLKAAEDQREHLTIILAGYQDEIENRLYASDPGFKSRFEDIVFQDYTETELREIFVNRVADMDWQLDPAMPRLAQVVAARIARGRGHRGFANARTVRSMVEKGVERASLAKRAPLLKVEDFIGMRPDVENIPELGAALAELDAMTGLKVEYNEDGSKKKRAIGIPPKEAILQLVQTVQGNYDKEIRGEMPLQVSLNRLFLGNPGTGKTTVAKLYGRILRELGLLSNGTVMLKQAGNFITGHEGGTEQSTLAILENAAGKVLVIDEAYIFNQSNYGKIAVDMIVSKVMGSPGEDIAVLMLGYEEPMLKMIRDQNPGLKRRFQPEDAFYFADFDDQELLEILKHRLESENLEMDRRVRAQATRLLAAERNKPHFGNAGQVDNLLSRAKNRMSARDRITRTFIVEDLGLAAEEAGAGGDPFKELESMHKTEFVIQELKELQANIRYEQKRGAVVEVPNYIFVGNPGTGKTRVARILASMLSKMGVLENKTKETTAQEIQGRHIGDTPAKAREMIEDAQGGILFVDEAHNLANSPYSIEAAKTLMTATLEDKHRGRTMLIFAGYKRPMDHMIQTVDPGMRRRFKRVIEFPDWDARDCTAFLDKLCVADGLQLDADARLHVLESLLILQQRPGWGNASDAIDAHKYLTSALAMRTSEDPAAPATRVVLDDAEKAMERFLRARPEAEPMQAAGVGVALHVPFGMRADAQVQDTALNNPRVETSHKIEALEDEGEPNALVRPAGDDCDDIFSSLQLACVELGYDRDQESRLCLIQILCSIQGGASFPEDILKCVHEKTGKNESVLSEMLRPQVPRLEASLKEAYDAEQARLAELKRLEEQQRLEEAEAKRKEFEHKQQRLRSMGRCPAGFGWYKYGAGWRCHGGSHYVPDSCL